MRFLDARAFAHPLVLPYPPRTCRFPLMSADQADRPISLPIEPGRANWLRLVGNQKQRERYGPAHRRRRHDFARRLERGEMILCLRCGGEIGPDQDWDLDHDNRDPSQSYPSHRSCNRAAPNRNVTSRQS